MNNPVPAKAKHSKPTRDAAWWVCLIATLSFSLWVANFLPIQPVQYRLTTNLAISQHRIPKLERLMSHGASYGEHSIRLVALEASGTEPAQPNNSELRSVRVVVALDSRAQAKEVEKSLDVLTEPSAETTECAELTKQIRQQRWVVESIQHSLKLLNLDQERDRLALSENDSSDPNTESSQSAIANETSGQTSPFRLTSHSSRIGLEQDSARLQKQLQGDSASESEKLDSMMLALERLRAKARGFVSMTGSPKIMPVVRSMTLRRLSILAILCFLIWSLCMAWVRPTHSLRKASSKRGWTILGQFIQRARRLAENIHLPIHQHPGRQQTLDWMSKVGIPYLGEVRVDGGRENELHPAPERPTESVLADTLIVDPREVPSFQRVETEPHGTVPSLKWMRSLAEGSLVLWLGLLVGRVMFDPSWRELVCVAPLAAISRMLFGIH